MQRLAERKRLAIRMTIATLPATPADRDARIRALSIAGPPADASGEIGRLRRCALRSQIAPRLDLERLVAAPDSAPDSADVSLWGVALIQTVARGRPVTFHRRHGAEATREECWLGALLSAIRQGDSASARFLVERHVRKADRRLALCFAQRLVAAEAITAEAA
jgi:hypothetical protein